MLTKINHFLKIKQIDTLLISNKENIGYLSNFWGSFGFLLISKKGKKLFTDGRYIEEAKKAVFSEIEIQDYQELKKHLKNKNISFEAENVTVVQLKNWKKKFSTTKFQPTQKIIENLRSSKTAEEIKKIQKSANINDRILNEIPSLVKIGMTEKTLVWKIRELAFAFGAEKMAFDTIVNFGKHTAHPHHEPDETKLKKGDLILLDFGVKKEKYCSDITRVFFTAKPSMEQILIFEILSDAQKKAIQQIEITAVCAEIDAAAREIIQKNGYAEYFTHSLGHGVGLEIHEAPSLSTSSQEKLTENSVFTLEPGIYLPGKFGMRLEDLFVYKNKKAHRLSKFTQKIEDLILKIS